MSIAHPTEGSCLPLPTYNFESCLFDTFYCLFFILIEDHRLKLSNSPNAHLMVCANSVVSKKANTPGTG